MIFSAHPLLPGLNSKTTPLPWAPLFGAVPNRFPLASRVKPAIGLEPSRPPEKACNTVSVHPPPLGDSSKATPFPCAPPYAVVPYELPEESKIRLDRDDVPSLQPGAEQNVCKTASCQPFVVGLSSKTTLPVRFTWPYVVP